MRELRGSPDTDAGEAFRPPDREAVDPTRPAYDPIEAAAAAPRSSEPRDVLPTVARRPGLELLRDRLTDHAATRFERTGPLQLEDWQADEYGMSIWGEATHNLSPAERAALTDYSRELFGGDARCYRQINGFLRGQLAASPEIDSHIEGIDSALKIIPVPDDLMVVRGTTAHAFPRPLGLLDGQPITEPAYLSTSIGQTPAFNHTIWVHLQVPKGTSAIYMEGVTDMPGERELLLGRGLTYVVDRADRDEMLGRWHVHGRILPPDEQQRSGS